jgi:hypothetical protein
MAGEKLFVDWAGDTIAVFDAATGEEQRAHIFVAAPRGKRQRSVRRGGRCGIARELGHRPNGVAASSRFHPPFNPFQPNPMAADPIALAVIGLHVYRPPSEPAVPVLLVRSTHPAVLL